VVEPIVDDVIDALEDEGATVIDGTDIDLSATANEFPALLCEFKTDIATYLQTYVNGTNPVSGDAYPQTLAELIAFNAANPDREGPWNDAVFEAAEETNGRDAACAGLRATTTPPVQAAIDQLMAANNLDAIIALTNGPAWPTNDDPDEGDLDGHFELFVGSSSAAAVSGYADITVPAGSDAGLPIGITFIGGRWAEPELLGFAYDYEQATEVRVPPQFIPTIGDDLFPGVPNPPDLAQLQPATQSQRELVVRFR
ncbi:MAG: amidase family protein, partial [Gaiellaceae bacterium]